MKVRIYAVQAAPCHRTNGAASLLFPDTRATIWPRVCLGRLVSGGRLIAPLYRNDVNGGAGICITAA
jgi:hypothetical protein